MNNCVDVRGILTTSFENANGITPFVETASIVGFKPTIAFLVDGEIIEPSVSLPRETAAKFTEMDTAEPLLEPEGFWFKTYALTVCPRRPFHPLGTLPLKLYS